MSIRELVIQVATKPDIRGVMTSGGIVFGSNRSASELQEFGEAVLPAIEDVLLHEAPIWLATTDPHKTAMGLEDIIHEYVRLAHAHRWTNGRTFLTKLSGPVLDLALSCFYAEYSPSMGERRLQPIPEWLIDAVREIRTTGLLSSTELLWQLFGTRSNAR